MCLGLPVQVISVEGHVAQCRGHDGDAVVADVALVAPVSPGEWLLSFLGAARGRLEADEAARIGSALGALAAIERGEAFDARQFFPDLVDREPELPEFLRTPR
jgi:hydrogenase expression/formation protein HypC